MKFLNVGWCLLTLAVCFFSNPSLVCAYIGPGAGITLIGSLWAVLIAIFLALTGIVMWPIRRILRRRRLEKEAAATAEKQAADVEGSK